MNALREVQIAQHTRITASMKNWEWIASLRKIIASGNSKAEGILTPMNYQHCFANSHCKKRWWTDSSVPMSQRTQLYDGRNMFFLFWIFLVLNLSLSNSQKNTMCFGWQKLFQIHWIDGWWCECPAIILYALEDEKFVPHEYCQISFPSFSWIFVDICTKTCNWLYAICEIGKCKRKVISPPVPRHLPQRSFYFWQRKITQGSLFPDFALPNYPGHLLEILKIF